MHPVDSLVCLYAMGSLYYNDIHHRHSLEILGTILQNYTILK